MNESQLARFVAKIDVEGSIYPVLGTRCWVWTANRYVKGYAQFKIDGKTRQGHRLSYEHFSGEIPADKELDHLCRNRPCVNPNHVEPVVHQVNVVRGVAPAVARERMRGNTQGLGYKHTDEHKARVSRRHRGKVNSVETRAKISAAKAGRPGPKHTEETKAKMAEARRAYWQRKREAA